MAEPCGFPVTTDVWGFCGFLSPQVCGTIRHPKKLSGSGFMDGGGAGGKDVHIKIKERAFHALYINVALDLCSY